MVLFLVTWMLLLQSCVVAEDVCSSPEHSVFNNDDFQKMFKKETLSKTDLFRSVVLNEKENKLIVGGKAKLAVLDAATLKIEHEESWETDKSSCLNEGQLPSNYCNNFITHLSIYKDQVVACGTGSLKPVYRVISLKDYSTVKQVQRDGVCASPNPNHRIVGQLTSLGEMIAGTYLDIKGSKSKVVGSYVTEKMQYYRENLQTNENDIHRDSEFVQSFYIDGSVYVFFMEEAEERDNEFTATVGRFCQTDNGAQPFISSRLWTTFRKARLTCQYEGKTDKTIFKNLVDVVYHKEKNVFYAAYTMTRHHNLGSAICTFGFGEIESVFTGNFLQKNEVTMKWTEVPALPFLNGCSVNKTFLESNSNNRISTGKEPTNKLDQTASLFLSNNRLMASTVLSKPKHLQYMRAGTRFARLTLDKIPTDMSGNEGLVINVIDENGNLFMLHEVLKNKELCVVEEIKTGIKDPKIFIMNEKLRVLYVSSSSMSDLHAINVDNCQRYQDKRACTGAHNIRCGWSNERTACLPLAQRGNLTLIQNLTQCPVRLDIFGAWSSWKPQKQEDGSERYCLVRHRECRSCDTSLCDMKTTEVINCTTNAIQNIDSWLENGSTDGSWSAWDKWSDCQQKSACGNRTMIRYRDCTSPLPLNGGKKCIGSNFECNTCPKEKDIVLIFWSEWEPWVSTQHTNDEIHYKRTRSCSKPNRCFGESVQTKVRPTSGTVWGEWSECSCSQLIQHRLPTYIYGCDEKDCSQLKKAQYQVCQPLHCPTVKPKNTADNKTDSNQTINVVSIKPNKLPTQNCKDGYRFELIELVSIGIGIIASCFVLVVVIVFLIIRRERKKNAYSPHDIRKTKSQPLLEATDTLDANSMESNA